LKKGTILQESGKPLQFANVENVDDQKAVVNPDLIRIADTFKAYMLEARNLFKARYAGLKDVAPLHLREVCNVLVLSCTDGLLARYDRS
jgi:hypothetical protein